MNELVHSFLFFLSLNWLQFFTPSARFYIDSILITQQLPETACKYTEVQV